MRVIKDFQCSVCNNKFERLVESECDTTACECGSEAKRVFTSFNFKLDGTDPGFPGAYDKWARGHEKAARSNT